jgi:uncharacterized protein
MSLPAECVYRSIFRGQIVFAQAGRVLEETTDRVVTVTLPGDDCHFPVGERLEVLDSMAAGRVRTRHHIWHTHRVLWLTPGAAAYSLGHFFDGETGRLKGYYVNLQAPLNRTRIGFDSCDYVLDVLVAADGTWRWKDEDEFALAIRLGIFSATEAAEIRAEGKRVIAQLPRLLPTGWEAWQPDPAWPAARFPCGWDAL